MEQPQGGKFLKCSCAHCGGRIEYPAAAIETSAPCPHCGRATELVLETPQEVVAPRRVWMIWATAALILLGIAGAIAPWILKRVAAKHQRHDPSIHSMPPRDR